MKVFCVISHTHWDREWYAPLEIFKLKLCDLFDRCLDTLAKYPEYIFHMDAQTIVLEDYLAIRPSRRDLLKKYIKEHRLIVGPWYLQNDFYLTSGEATVRNLIEGHMIAEEFGSCSKVGYAPDQFGNISQLPQILADFDIDNFIFGRGLRRDLPEGGVMPSEFTWEGADGTKALAVHMRYWYNNAQRFSTDIERAKILVETNERLFNGVAVTPYLLLMNGVDHLEAQDDLLPILDKVNKKLDDGKVVKQYIMDNYIADIKKYISDNNLSLRHYKGEFRSNGDYELLKGTLSSRIYLKISNVKAQTMLENRLEPLYSMLELAGAEGIYSLDHFRYMWKELLKNHPHDSICGCSCDEVHGHMEDNYRRLRDTSAEIFERGMKFAALHLDTAGKTKDNYIIAIANTTQSKMSGVCEVTVDIVRSEGFEGIEIIGGDGSPADYMVISKTETLRDGFSPLNLPGNFPVDRYKVYLYAKDVAPFAVKGYVVKGTHTANEIGMLVNGSDYVLENDFLKVTVDSSGKVEIVKKSTNKVYKNVINIEDTADRGDAYVYWSAPESPIYGNDFMCEKKLLKKNKYVTEIEISRNLTLPKEYDFVNLKRSDETAVTKVKLTLKLEAGSEKLEIGFEIDNKSSDHRIRLVVDTGIVSDIAIADIPFDIVGHTDADHSAGTQSKVFPNSTFAVLEHKNEGFAVLTEGIHEFEHIKENKTLSFTLLRATATITRDCSTFKVGGGDQWMVPGNQCIRKISGRLALMPYSGDYITAGIPIKSIQFRAPLYPYYTSCDEHKFLRGRTSVQDTRLEEFFFIDDPYANAVIHDNTSPIDVSGHGIIVTALKKYQNGSGIVMRAVNLSTSDSVMRLDNVGKVYNSNMSETKKEFAKKNIFSKEMGTKKIVTLIVD